MPETIRADLHMHGPIGFQNYWLKVQGYEDKNLIELLAETCMNRKIDICTITSEAFQIPENSVHDRFGYLFSKALFLPEDKYDFHKEKEDDIMFLIERKSDGRKLYIMNGMTAIAYVYDGGEKRRIDHLVIGTNRIPSNLHLEEVVRICNGEGWPHGPEHGYSLEHCGLGEEEMEKIVDDVDFIETHNAQLTLPRALRKFPICRNYTRDKNDMARYFAIKHKKARIANSDAHRIEDAGIACTEILDIELARVTRGRELIELMKKRFEDPKNIEPVEGYIGIKDWFDWTSKFKIGVWFHPKCI